MIKLHISDYLVCEFYVLGILYLSRSIMTSYQAMKTNSFLVSWREISKMAVFRCLSITIVLLNTAEFWLVYTGECYWPLSGSQLHHLFISYKVPLKYKMRAKIVHGELQISFSYLFVLCSVMCMLIHIYWYTYTYAHTMFVLLSFCPSFMAVICNHHSSWLKLPQSLWNSTEFMEFIWLWNSTSFMLPWPFDSNIFIPN